MKNLNNLNKYELKIIQELIKSTFPLSACEIAKRINIGYATSKKYIKTLSNYEMIKKFDYKQPTSIVRWTLSRSMAHEIDKMIEEKNKEKQIKLSKEYQEKIKYLAIHIGIIICSYNQEGRNLFFKTIEEYRMVKK
jgi:predicted transcriptional regulator